MYGATVPTYGRNVCAFLIVFASFVKNALRRHEAVFFIDVRDIRNGILSTVTFSKGRETFRVSAMYGGRPRHCIKVLCTASCPFLCGAVTITVSEDVPSGNFKGRMQENRLSLLTADFTGRSAGLLMEDTLYGHSIVFSNVFSETKDIL